jgi:hypothetical protein
MLQSVALVRRAAFYAGSIFYWEVFFMKRIMSPMLFLLANTPDVERNLKILMSMLQATTDSVQSIKNGIDNIQATIMNMSGSTAPGQPAQPDQAGQEPDSAVNPEPAEPVEGGKGPAVQMPGYNSNSPTSSS